MEKNAVITSNVNCILIQLFLFVITFIPFIEGAWLADLTSRIMIIIFIILFIVNIYFEKTGRTFPGKWGRRVSPARFSIGIGVSILAGFIYWMIVWTSYDGVVITYLMLQTVTAVIAIVGGVLKLKSE